MAKLLGAELMYTATYPRRGCFPLRMAAGVSICLLLSYAVPIRSFSSPGASMLTFAWLFGCTVLSLLLCYQCSVWNILFAAIAGYLAEHFVSQTGNLMRLFPVVKAISEPAQDAVCNLIPLLIFYPLFYFCFARHIHRGEHPNVDNKKLILIAELSLVLCILISVLALDSQQYLAVLALPVQNLIFFIEYSYAMLCCVVVLMLLFGILTQRKLQTDLTLTQYLLHQEQEQYRISKENIELINIRCHDLKHQISALRENATEESIREIERAVLIYDSVVKTGNNVLDVILTEKSLYCQQHQIRFTCIVDGGHLNLIETSDLYSLFGNLVDNAIEALEKLEDVQMRNLSLNVKQVGQYLVIWIENPYSGQLRFVDGLPQTTKQDREYHGYGMKSIQMLVNKYKGTLLIDAADQLFRIKIVLPVPDDAK